MKIVISFFRQLFILICASVVACLVLGVSDFIASFFESNFTIEGKPVLIQHQNAVCGMDFLSLEGIGYAIGAPALFLIYFPVSIILRRKNYKTWTFILSATTIASLYALFLCYQIVADTQGDQYAGAPDFFLNGLFITMFLKIYPIAGLLTGVFHSLILARWQNQLQKIAITLAVLIGAIALAGTIILHLNC